MFFLICIFPTVISYHVFACGTSVTMRKTAAVTRLLQLLFSSDTAQRDSENQHQDAHRHINIFTDRVKPGGKVTASSFIYLFFHILFSTYPKQHDTSQSGSQRADVDRKYIHPAGYDTLDQNGNNHADHCDHRTCRFSLQMEFLLHRCDRCFVQVDQGCQPRK